MEWEALRNYCTPLAKERDLPKPLVLSKIKLYFPQPPLTPPMSKLSPPMLIKLVQASIALDIQGKLVTMWHFVCDEGKFDLCAC